MIPSQNCKSTLPIFRASTTNGGTASGNIDTLGINYLKVSIMLPTSDNVTNNPSVLKLSESDDTVVTNFSDIVGARGDTDFTIPNCITAATSISGPFTEFNVKCGGNRKRYIKVSVTPLTTQIIDVLAQGFVMKESPNNTTEANSLAVVNL